MIDVHIHHYPLLAQENPLQWAQQRSELHWAELVTSLAGKSPLQAFASEERLLADMDAAGVEHSVIQSWYWQQQATCNEQNEYLAQFCAGSGGRLSFFASVQPKEGKGCLKDLEVAIEKGAKGIGEVFPEAQGYSMQDSVWYDVLALAQDHQLPVLLHVTEPVGHLYPGKLTPPLAQYQQMVVDFPQVRFIFAHWGGGLLFYELNPYMKEIFQNVYYDTAASPLLYGAEVWRSACDLVGPKKILYGSDYPLRLYPRTQKEADFRPLINEFQSASLTPEQRQAIGCDNAKRLLGLQ